MTGAMKSFGEGQSASDFHRESQGNGYPGFGSVHQTLSARGPSRQCGAVDHRQGLLSEASAGSRAEGRDSAHHLIKFLSTEVHSISLPSRCDMSSLIKKQLGGKPNMELGG